MRGINKIIGYALIRLEIIDIIPFAIPFPNLLGLISA
jgi:hypothetical protein